jgi:hypothetical protein
MMVSVSRSARAILGGTLLAAAAPALAQSLPYTPTTGLPTLHVGTAAFPINQIGDGIDGPAVANGFGSSATSGDITFTFATPMDLTGFELRNNIIVDAIGGVKHFTLSFFAANGSPLGQSAHLASTPNAVNPILVSMTRAGVSRVVMHVIDSHTRIEIREVRFQGRPASYTLSCAQVGHLGFGLTTQTIQRSSNAVDRGAITIPHSYAVGPLRAYGDASANRMFIDSFPLNPNRERHVCGADVTVTGSSGNVSNNDSANVFLPSSAGTIWWDLHGWEHGSPLSPNKALTNNMGPWTYNLAVTGANPAMAQPLADALHSLIPGGPYIDIWVHDDSVVNSVNITYTLY